MPVKVNGIISNFKVKAELDNYPILPGNTIQTGDLLKFIELDGQTYVTNDLKSEDYIEGIARFGNINRDIIPVYVLTYRARYRDLVFPYVILEQFTYDKLRTKIIKNAINTKCSTLSRHLCSEISKYNCNNLNTYGARIDPLT